MSSDTPSTRDTLLGELESICQLLDGGDPATPAIEAAADSGSQATAARHSAAVPPASALPAAALPASTPPASAPPAPDQPAPAHTRAVEPLMAADALPGQQSLFEILGPDPLIPDSKASHAASPPAKTAPPEPANPFLPAAATNSPRRRPLAAAIERAAAQTPGADQASDTDQTPRSQVTATSASDALIDSLVQEYLPRIEAELRRRLKARLQPPAAACPTPATDSDDQAP